MFTRTCNTFVLVSPSGRDLSSTHRLRQGLPAESDASSRISTTQFSGILAPVVFPLSLKRIYCFFQGSLNSLAYHHPHDRYPATPQQSPRPQSAKVTFRSELPELAELFSSLNTGFHFWASPLMIPVFGQSAGEACSRQRHDNPQFFCGKSAKS